MKKLDHTVTFTVNQRKYLIELMPPLEALEYAPKVTAVIVPAIPALMTAGGALARGQAESILEAGTALGRDPETFVTIGRALADSTLSGLMRQALAYVKTPEGGLESDFDFNQWFRKYPMDMFEVAGRAVWEQVREYLPPGLNIADAASSFTTPAPPEETDR